MSQRASAGRTEGAMTIGLLRILERAMGIEPKAHFRFVNQIMLIRLPLLT